MIRPSSDNWHTEDDVVTAAMQRAVRAALETHRRLGNPVAVSRGGCVVWLKPEEIPVFEPLDRVTRSDCASRPW